MRFADVLVAALAVFFAVGTAASQAPIPPEGEAPPPPPASDAGSDSNAPQSGAILPARVEGVATVGDLARLHSQVMVAEAQKKLREAQGGGAAKLSSDATEEGVDTPETGSNARRSYASPVVVGIHGTAQSPYALVRVSDAAVVAVRRGDELPGGLEVEKVGHDGVVVRGADGERVLGFSSALPAPAASPPRR